MKAFDGLRIKGRHEFEFRDVETGRVRSFAVDNLVTTVGKAMLARRLAGEGNACDITHGAFGSGDTEPTVADTTLEAETVRKPVTSITASGVECRVKVYFGPTEANGTLREYGLFGEDASGDPDTGTLFCRAAINTTKTSLETLTVRSTITML